MQKIAGGGNFRPKKTIVNVRLLLICCIPAFGVRKTACLDLFCLLRETFASFCFVYLLIDYTDWLVALSSVSKFA